MCFFINHTVYILYYLRVQHPILIGAALWHFMAHWCGPCPETFAHHCSWVISVMIWKCLFSPLSKEQFKVWFCDLFAYFSLPIKDWKPHRDRSYGWWKRKITVCSWIEKAVLTNHLLVVSNRQATSTMWHFPLSLHLMTISSPQHSTSLSVWSLIISHITMAHLFSITGSMW